MKFFTTLLFVFLSLISRTQVCTGNFVFYSQADIDQFLVDNPTCTSIDGDVTIPVSNLGDIHNLDGLQNISSITGDFNINSTLPTGEYLSLLGLGSLTLVGGEFNIADTPSFGGNILSLDGLQNLVSVSSLSLSYCSSIISISELDALASCNSIQINNCENVDYINIFPNLVSLNGGFGMLFGGHYAHFDGFHALTSCGDIGMIANCCGDQTIDLFNAFDQLVTASNIYFAGGLYGTIAGFENLETITGMYFNNYCNTLPDFNSVIDAYYIQMNLGMQSDLNFPLLTHVDNLTLWGYQNADQNVWMPSLITFNSIDLNGLHTFNAPSLVDDAIVGVGFSIVACDFVDLGFLSNIQSLQALNVTIANNPYLTSCTIDFLCDLIINQPELLYIQDNGPGCSSITEVGQACSFSYVTGNVYADLDCDGIFNNADVAIPNALIQDASAMPVGATYNNGDYYVAFLDNTTNVLKPVVTGFDALNTHTFVTTSDDSIFSGYDFAMCPQPGYHNVSIDLFGHFARPGFVNYASVFIQNHGPYVEDVIVVMDISNMPGVTFQNISGGTISGNTITWNISGLNLFESQYINVSYYLEPTPVLGATFHPSATIQIDPASVLDIDPSDNVSFITITVVGSFDPNEKIVDRSAINITEIPNGESTSLEYTIHFQNTGTAEALIVRLEDDIPNNLDLTTFQMLGASHPFQLSFEENGRVEWLFDNINLPDSASDMAGSMGFVQFKINTIEGLGISDVVENAASIYFDFNEAIVTNTAQTIFFTCPVNPTITGSPTVCSGESVLLETAADWTSYDWRLNDVVLGNQNTLEWIASDAGSHHFELTTTTTYCNATTAFDMVVNETPDAPTISQNVNTLTASGTGEFTWMLNGNVLSSTTNTIDFTESGNYEVYVLLDGCTSATTLGNFLYTEIFEMLNASSFSITPNPMMTNAFIRLNGAMDKGQRLCITDATGRVVFETNVTSNSISISQEELTSGMYFVKVVSTETGKGEVMKLIVQ